MGDNTGWSDLNNDGRRLERILKSCESQANTYFEKGNYEMYFSFIDRIIKVTPVKATIARYVLGVDELLKDAKKKAGTQELYQVSPRT